MAYELVFSYKEKNSDLTKTFKKHIGKLESDEEIPLEQVLGVIIGQFARRSRLIESVEIFEYTKKKVKFKEIKGGYVIKDKKFLMDQIPGISIAASDDSTEEEAKPVVHPHEMIQKPPNILPPKVLNDSVPYLPLHPQRFEVFDPDPLQAIKIKGKYRLTEGNRYGIYREWTGIGGIPHYLIKDDRGMETQISAEYFIVPGRGLIGGEDFNEPPMRREAQKKLAFQDDFLEDKGMVVGNKSLSMAENEIPESLLQMPDIRRGR